MPSSNDPKFWDQIARKYAAGPVEDMPAYEKTLERTRSYLGPEHKVLEFACGTGSTALALAPHAGHYLATDISGEMIAIAREKAAGGPANLELSAGTLDDPRLEEGMFDMVIGFNALHMLEDVPAALARIHSLLKPGGVFISKTPCLKDGPFIYKLVIPVMQAVGKAPYVTFLSAIGIEQALESAGFDVLERDWHGSKGRDIRPFLVARRR